MISFENPFIIYSAYALAFFPWTIISATDYLNEDWKSTRETYQKGVYNLWMSMVPVLYLSFYMSVQLIGKQYTEFCTAFIALLFAFSHGVKTAWGLWQLHEFVIWVDRSVRALQKVGIPVELKVFNIPYTTADEISKNILVNDTVVDNQISYSRTRCFLIYGKKELHFDTSDRYGKKGEKKSFLISFLSEIWRMVFSFLVLLDLVSRGILYAFIYLLHRCVKLKINFPWAILPPVRLVPYKPVHVWMVWSSVFASQCLGSWISNFNITDSSLKLENVSSMQKFFEKELAFSSEFLSSIILQMIPEIALLKETSANCFSIPFLSGINSENRERKLIELPLVSEILETAARSGDIFPFECPHIKEDFEEQDTSIGLFKRVFSFNIFPAEHPQGNGARDSQTTEEMRKNPNWMLNEDIKHNRGYARFQRILGRVLSEFPVLDNDEFFPDIDKYWDTKAVDALTTLLFVGYLGVKNDDERAQAFEIRTNRNGDVGSLSAQEEYNKHEIVNNQDGEDSMALKNLEEHLGYYIRKGINDRRLGTKSVTSPFKISCPFPYPWERVLSSNNKNVLLVAEIADLWISMSAGSDFDFLLNKISADWKNWCQGNIQSNEHESDERDDEVEQAIKEKDLVMIHKHIEIRRLRFKFADKIYLHGRLDQFMTFMGYGMETVRSILTFIIVSIYDNKEFVRLDQGRNLEHFVSDYVLEPTIHDSFFNLPDVFQMKGGLLNSFLLAEDKENFFKKSASQVRLLWEIKNEIEEKCLRDFNFLDHGKKFLFNFEEEDLRNLIQKENIISLTPYLVVLCILSFPSISFLPESEDCRSQNRENDVGISFQSRNRFFIIPRCGPQNVKISVTILNHDGERKVSYKVGISLQDQRSDFKFIWRLWRDAFTGRLQGMSEWRKLNGLMSHNPSISESNILVSPEKSDFFFEKEISIWRGWYPFRGSFALYEIAGTGILKQGRRIEKISPVVFYTAEKRYNLQQIAVRKVETVNYEKASPQVRRNFSVLMNYFIKNPLKKIGDGSSTDYIFELSKTFEEKKDFLAASQILEILALNQNDLEALKRWFSIFFNEQGAKYVLKEEFPKYTMRRTFQELKNAANLIEGFLGTFYSPSDGNEKSKIESYKDILNICDQLVKRYGENRAFVKLLATPVEICHSVLAGHDTKLGLYVISKALSYTRTISPSTPGEENKSIAVKYARLFTITNAGYYRKKIGPRLRYRRTSDLNNNRIVEKLSQDINKFQIILLQRRYDENIHDSELLYHLALFVGLGVFEAIEPNSEDREKAKTYFREIKDPEYESRAKLQLAKLLIHSENEDSEEGITLLKQIITENNDSHATDACNELAIVYSIGSAFIEQDPEMAKHYYTKVKKESPLAKLNLAELLWDFPDQGESNHRNEAIDLCHQVEGDDHYKNIARSNYINFSFLKDPENIENLETYSKELEDMSGSTYSKLIRGNILSSSAVQSTELFLGQDQNTRDIIIKEAYDYVIHHGEDTGYYFWLNQSLRKSEADVLVHGGRTRFLKGPIKYEYLHNLGSLNLASFLIECGQDSRENSANLKEAIRIYRTAFEDSNSLWAGINLAHIIWHGKFGEERNETEAMRIMEKLPSKKDELVILLSAFMKITYSKKKRADEEEAIQMYSNLQHNQLLRLSDFEELLKPFKNS